MPDKFICDCGYSSETYAENCPMCGALMMTIDSDFEDVDDMQGEKYEDSSDESEEEVPTAHHRKTA